MLGGTDRASSGDERGISPVVGGLVLIGIVILLVSAVFVMVQGFGDGTDPAPQTSIDLEPNGSGHEIVHRGGETLGSGNGRLVVEGVENPDVLRDRILTSGDTVPVNATEEAVEIYWHSGDDEESYTIATFDADPVTTDDESEGDGSESVPSPPADKDCDWVEERTGDDGEEFEAEAGDNFDSGDVVECDRIDEIVDNEFEVEGNITIIGDVEVSEDVDLSEGTTIVGNVTGVEEIELESDIEIYGDVDLVEDFDLENSSVTGDVYTEGSLELEDSEFDGTIAAEGEVELEGVTADGAVFTGGAFDCSDSTIDGEPCSEYDERDIGAY